MFSPVKMRASARMGGSCSELTWVWLGSSSRILSAGRLRAGVIPSSRGLFGKGMFSSAYQRQCGWAELGRLPRCFRGWGQSVSLSPHLGFHGCKMNTGIRVSWRRGGDRGQFFLKKKNLKNILRTEIFSEAMLSPQHAGFSGVMH